MFDCLEEWYYYMTLKIDMKLHVYGTRGTMYMYIWSKEMFLYFQNLLFLLLVDVIAKI